MGHFHKETFRKSQSCFLDVSGFEQAIYTWGSISSLSSGYVAWSVLSTFDCSQALWLSSVRNYCTRMATIPYVLVLFAA